MYLLRPGGGLTKWNSSLVCSHYVSLDIKGTRGQDTNYHFLEQANMWISSAVSFSVIFVALIHGITKLDLWFITPCSTRIFNNLKLVSSISGIQEIVDGRIYGGTPAKIGEFPYVVAIKVNEEFRCGGFIYNERWIVTAASCVDG